MKLLHTSFLLLLLSVPVFASPTRATVDPDAGKLRYRLQNVYNEFELLIRNESTNRSDIRRLKREIEMFRIYDRVPFTPELKSLQKELMEAAKESHLAPIAFRFDRYPPRTVSPIPAQVFSDGKVFTPSRDQLVETIPFRMWVGGSRKSVKRWVGAWYDSLIRLAVPDGGYAKPKIRWVGHRLWLVHGKAYRFRAIRYPRIVVRSPLEYLDPAIRRDLTGFSKREPQLWALIEKSNRLIGRVQPLYDQRREFLLDKARMDFILSLQPKSG